MAHPLPLLGGPDPGLARLAGRAHDDRLLARRFGYDTIYAYVDADDDARLGLKFTAILFGRHGRRLIGLLYGLAIAGWALGGWMVDMSPLYVFGIVFLAGQMALQVWRFDLARPDVNFRQFRANILTGGVLAATAFLGTFSL
jgi:4-hydroxybenzoate polyprenyltransferase